MTEWDLSVANLENQASHFLASAVPCEYTMWVAQRLAEADLCSLFMLLLSAVVSRDDVEGLLLMEEEGHSDLISFQPTDSDIPSFLEDCNRVRLPFPSCCCHGQLHHLIIPLGSRLVDWFALELLISLTLFHLAIQSLGSLRFS